MKTSETRTKILMVLNAINSRISTEDLLNHELLKDEKLSLRSLGINLSLLKREKLVRRYKDKTWGSTAGREETELKAEGISTPLGVFVINTTDKTISLDVGGVRLPVHFES